MTYYTWTGGSGDFSDSSMWENDSDGNDGEGVPGSGDTAEIGAAGLNTNAGTITGSGSVGAMHIAGGVTFESGTITVGSYGLIIDDGTNVVGEGGTLDCTAHGITAFQYSGGELEVSGGTLKSDIDEIGVGTGNGGTVTLEVTGGTFQDNGLSMGPTETTVLDITGGASVTDTGGATLDNTTVTLTGSTWHTGGIFLGEQTASSLTATGGSLSADTTFYLNHNSTAMISGTTFTAGELSVLSGTLTLEGGTTTTLSPGDFMPEISVAGGILEITGSSTTLTGAGLSQVSGGGLLDVTSGAHGQDGDLEVFAGTLSLLGSGTSWKDTGSDGTAATIGYDAAGALSIGSGASMTDTGAVLLGYADPNVSGVKGTVTLKGASSLWTVNGNLGIGDTATGKVSITTGAKLNLTGKTHDLDLGVSKGGVGQLTVDNGTASTAGNILEGYGKDTITVKDGGTLSAALDMEIGVSAGSNASAAVTGTGSSLSITSHLYIGDHGVGALTVEDGATATIKNSVAIGEADKGTLTVESDATFAVTGGNDLDLGFTKTASGTLVVNDGHVSAAGGNIIEAYGSNSVTVSDGGVLAASDTMGIGTIKSYSSTATITGKGSNLILGKILEVGVAGTGSLTVENKAEASAGTWLMAGATSTGKGTINIDDATVTAGTGTAIGGNQTKAGGTADVSLTKDALLQAGDQLIVWGDGTLSVDKTSSVEVGAASKSAGDVSIGKGGSVTLYGDSSSYDAKTLIDGGTLTVNKSGASGNDAIAFKGTGGDLVVASNVKISNDISDFAKGDKIDLRGITDSNVKLSYANDILTVTQASHSETLHFSGNYKTSDFKASSDGHGGTYITVTTSAKDAPVHQESDIDITAQRLAAEHDLAHILTLDAHLLG